MQYETIRADQEYGDGTDDLKRRGDNPLEALKEVIIEMYPPDVKVGGETYVEFAKRMGETVDLLLNQAGKMAEAWGGDAAQAALEKMKSLYLEIREMQTAVDSIGNALTGHAETQFNWQREVPKWDTEIETDIFGSATLGSATKNAFAAKRLMSELQMQTVQANNGIPKTLRVPDASAGVMPLGPNQGVPGGVGGAGGLSAGAGRYVPPSGGASGYSPPGMDAGQFPGGAAGGHVPGGTVGSDIPGGGTDLAGYTPPGGDGGGGGALGGGGPVAGGGALGGGGPVVGAGVAGPGFTGVEKRESGARGAAGGFPGIGSGAGRNGAASDGSRKSGTGGMPMGHGGGGHGGDGEEKQREVWLAEDDDIWGGDDGAVPPVIG